MTTASGDWRLTLLSRIRSADSRSLIVCRIMLAPMMRCRALGGIPRAAHVGYYVGRATQGGFFITEGTLVTPRHLSTCPSTDDSTDAKLVSTVFLLAPHGLTSLRHVITPAIAILSIRRLSNPNSALSLFNFLSDELHVSHSATAYCYVIAFLVRSNLRMDALKLFDEMTKREELSADPSFIDFFLNSCIKAGDLESCLQLISRSVELRCRIPVYIFNNLLNLLISRNRAKDAIFLFREHSRSQLFSPDTCSFNNIINGCCRLGDIGSAFRFLKEMRDFGCPPDTITHNVLIDGLCKANQVERGWEILSRIKFDSSWAPNVKTYTSIVSGYCKLGKMEEAQKVFDEMVESGIKPSSVTYNVLIHGYGKVGNLRSSISTYERMRVCGCSPDVVTFTSLIHGYCLSGQLDDALKLLDEMSVMKVQPNAYTFSVVINSLCKKNRLKEARDLVSELNGRENISAGAFVYNPVIDGLCKAGDVEEANLILVEMEARGCKPDKFTYTILIIGHCMRGRMTEAIGLFNRMVATGCVPDTMTIDSFVSCLLKAGMPHEAKRIMSTASASDMGSDGSSLKEVPSSLANSANVSVAV